MKVTLNCPPLPSLLFGYYGSANGTYGNWLDVIKVGSAQYKAWQFLEKHGRATSLAIASDPNVDLGRKAAQKALRRLRNRGAASVVGFKKMHYGNVKIYEVGDKKMAPSQPIVYEI